MSAAPDFSRRTGELVSLDEVDKHASDALGMNKADQAATRAGPAEVVDQRYAGLLKHGKRGVDGLRLERDVVQSFAASGNELGDGALVLARRSGLACADIGRMAGIEGLQEFTLAGADRDERDPQTADRLGRPRMIDDAVLVGGEAFDRDRHLHIGLLAFQRTSDAAGPCLNAAPVVRAGDTEMIDSLDI